MKKDIADKWVEALRSGDYKQAEGKLQTTNGSYCCLGVLQGPVLGLPIMVGEAGCLSKDAMEQSGMSTDLGMPINGEGHSLSSLNDLQMNTFDEIADYIESHYENL